MSVMPHASPSVQELVRRIDAAMAPKDDESRCRNVKNILEELLGSGNPFLDPRFLAPTPDCYARRLLHRDPAGRYTVVVMVWDKGQGTPLHDHSGMWCVECVYQGRIRVTSYSVRGGNPETGIVQFQQENVIHAGVGEAGALIPPFEYHILENAIETPAITIHVYGGEMTSCHTFTPVDGGWKRGYRELTYTA